MKAKLVKISLLLSLLLIFAGCATGGSGSGGYGYYSGARVYGGPAYPYWYPGFGYYSTYPYLYYPYGYYPYSGYYYGPDIYFRYYYSPRRYYGIAPRGSRYRPYHPGAVKNPERVHPPKNYGSRGEYRQNRGKAWAGPQGYSSGRSNRGARFRSGSR